MKDKKLEILKDSDLSGLFEEHGTKEWILIFTETDYLPKLQCTAKLFQSFVLGTACNLHWMKRHSIFALFCVTEREISGSVSV
jgi:hypothetical protein